MKTKYESFNFKYIKMIIGNLVDGDYWITDGHIAVNTKYFTPKLPKECLALIAAKKPFSFRDKVFDFDTIPEISRVIPNGPRYILCLTDILYHKNEITCSILYGHDRPVYVQRGMIDAIETCEAGLDKLNFLQNYDNPNGAINVYLNSQDHESEKPVALMMPTARTDCYDKVEGFVTSMSAMFSNKEKAVA